MTPAQLRHTAITDKNSPAQIQSSNQTVVVSVANVPDDATGDEETPHGGENGDSKERNVMALSAIEWCKWTYNPFRGCVKTAGGCLHCYAEVNYSVKMHGIEWGTEDEGGTRKRAALPYLKQPHRWNTESAPAMFDKSDDRPRVFCASLADVFEPWSGPMLTVAGIKLFSRRTPHILASSSIPGSSHPPRLLQTPLTMQECRDDLFDTIRQTPNLDWLLLSKHGFFSVPYGIESANDGILKMWPKGSGQNLEHFKNVWLLCSVSDQPTHDLWTSQLFKCGNLARLRGLSCEPLTGPIDLTLSLPWIDWVIVGGESGPHARICNEVWINDIVNQCREAGVPVFVKQLGRIAVVDGVERKFVHKKGGDPSEWPRRVRHREYPKPLNA